MHGLSNAVLSFKAVAIPAEDMLGPEGRGMKLALTTLNTGRLTLPAAATGVAKRCLGIVRSWGNERVQWGSPVGRQAAVADKIGRMAATLFAMESMTLLTSGLVDLHRGDIRIEAGMCKMWCTEAAWEIVNDTLQVRGGRGYETPASLRARGEKDHPVERLLRDARINTVFEGSSEILRLFLAREALDPHLRIAGDALNPKLPAGRRAAGWARAAAHYSLWYPATWWPFAAAPAGLHPRLARRASAVGRSSRRLARRLFHAMAAHGPRLEREQVLLGRVVDAGTELFAHAAPLAPAQWLPRRGDPAGAGRGGGGPAPPPEAGPGGGGPPGAGPRPPRGRRRGAPPLSDVLGRAPKSSVVRPAFFTRARGCGPPGRTGRVRRSWWWTL